MNQNLNLDIIRPYFFSWDEAVFRFVVRERERGREGEKVFTNLQFYHKLICGNSLILI
jgi:hypothetical protein